MWQRKQAQQRGFGISRDMASAAARIAKAVGADPKVLMKRAAAKAKASGFCTGKMCRVEEIRTWAHRQGRSLGGALGAFAEAIVAAPGKVTQDRC